MTHSDSRPNRDISDYLDLAPAVVDLETGEIDGPNAVGKARIKIEGEFKATEAQQSDPLTGARLPKEYREHVGDYFDKLREGEKADSVRRADDAAKPKAPEAEGPKE